MPPSFRTINNPYLTPLGAQLVITGLSQFQAASTQIQRSFQAIGAQAASTAAQVQALNTSLTAFNARAGQMAAIGTRARNIPPVSGARGIPVIGGGSGGRRGGGGIGLGGLGSLEPGGQARAFFGQRAGPLAVYTKLPVTLNATVVAALAAGAAITGLGAKLEQTSRQVQVFGDTTEHQMGVIRQSAIDMSREFTAGAGEIAQGALQLAKAGAPLDDLNNNILRSVVVLNQASQGEVDLTAASDTLVQGITALNLEWSESPKFVGALIAAVQGSTASFSDFTLQLKQTLPVAGLLKFNYDELFASLALLNQAGLRGSIAGTALKNALIAIADPTSEAAEILEKYNISLFDAEGKSLPLIEILGRLTDAFNQTTSDITDAQRFFETTDIFNTRQILAALSVINQGEDAYAGFLATVRGGISTGEQVARSLQNNLIDQLRLIWNNAVAASHALSGEFLPSLTRIATAVREGMSDNNLEGYREFGRTINELLTFNNKFVNSLIIEVAPGVLLLGESFNNLAAAITPVGVKADAAGNAFIKLAAIISAVSGAIAREINQIPDALRELEGRFLRTYIVFKGIQKLFTDPAAAQELNRLLLEETQKAIAAGMDLQTSANATLTALRRYFGAEAELMLAEIAASGKSATQIAAESVIGITAVTADGIINLLNNADAAHAEILARMQARARAFISSQNPVMSREQQAFMEANTTLGVGGVSVSPLPVARPVGGGAVFPPSSGGGGGKESAEDELKKITAQVRAALSSIPALTDDLVDFIASIAQDAPERLQPMLAAINNSREQIGNLVVGKRNLLAIDLQLIGVEERLANLNAQAARIDIEQAIALIGFERQLLGMRLQSSAIEKQMQPIQDRLLEIDRQSERINRNNLAIERELLGIQLESLPIQNQIADIERAIERTNRTNFDLERMRINAQLASMDTREAIFDIEERINKLNRINFSAEQQRLRLDLEALGTRRQIRDLEEEITNLVDKRANLLSRRQEILGSQEVQALEEQLTGVEESLAAAWESMDVPEILRLEELKTATEEALTAAEKNLDGIQKAQRKTAETTELATIDLELEKLTLEEQLEPIEKRMQLLADSQEQQALYNQLTLLGLERQKQALDDLVAPFDEILRLIERESELYNIRNELVRLGLEEEKQKLIDLLEPFENKRLAIEREIEAENLRNQVTLTHLEEEKRRLQDQLIPLEDQRKALSRLVDEINFMRDAASLEFEERKIGIREMILQEQLRQSELEATRKKQALLFAEMVLGLAETLEASEAFTLDEALEVAKRSRLWDEQVDKIAESVTEFVRLDNAARAAGLQIAAIERDVTITITTVYKSVYESSGTPPGPATTADPGVAAFAGGGIVPGKRGEPMLILAHGGERVTSVTSATVPSYVRARESGHMRVGEINNYYNTTYSVNPSYSNYESPASIRDDLRAIIMMANN